MKSIRASLLPFQNFLLLWTWTTLLTVVVVQVASLPLPLMSYSTLSLLTRGQVLDTRSAAVAGVFDDTSVELSFMKGYADFQISDGYGGTAEEEAAEIFIQPFENVDLSTIPYEVFDKLKLAKEVAEDIEIEVFEPAVDRAGEDTETGQALKVGLEKNRVLFATAGVQLLKIEAAHNKVRGLVDPYEKEDLDYAEAYLAWTIETDLNNAGERSLGVT